MSKKQSKRMVHAHGLIVFLWLVHVVGATGLSSATPPSRTFAAAQMPVTTPQSDKEPPLNVVQQVFSRIKDIVTRPFRKRVPVISDPPVVIVKPSTSLILSCPPATRSDGNCLTPGEVTLSATAGGPDVDAKLLFAWNVTAGRVRGEGPNVIWDLNGISAGTYKATVEVKDGQLAANDSTTVTIARCPDCVTWESPCPTISVSCPADGKSKQPVMFVASVFGGDSDVKLTYTWSVSVGKIIRGQGTSQVIVEAPDSADQSLTATVTIGGIDSSCSATASCTTGIAVRQIQLDQ